MTPLSRPSQRYSYVDHGPDIYVDSFATIRRESDLSRVPGDAERLAVRMIHGTGQVDLVDDTCIVEVRFIARNSSLVREARPELTGSVTR